MRGGRDIIAVPNYQKKASSSSSLFSRGMLALIPGLFLYVPGWRAGNGAALVQDTAGKRAACAARIYTLLI